MDALPSDFLLRPAVNQDWNAVCALFTAVHKEYGFTLDFEKRDADLNDIEAHYPADCAWFVVLWDVKSDQLAGTVALKPVKNEAKDVIELGRLYMYPQYRGQGLGGTLMRLAIEKAQALGYRRMVLETHSSMTEAIALYEKLGFRRTPPFSEAGKKDLAYCDYAAELLL